MNNNIKHNFKDNIKVYNIKSIQDDILRGEVFDCIKSRVSAASVTQDSRIKKFEVDKPSRREQLQFKPTVHRGGIITPSRWNDIVVEANTIGKQAAKVLKRTLAYKDNTNVSTRNHYYAAMLQLRMTPSEKKMGYLLGELNIPFMFQKGMLKPFHRIFDFYLPEHKVAIEVDGKYHEDIHSKDAHKDSSFYSARGIKTIRIKNEDLDNPRRLKRFILSRIK